MKLVSIIFYPEPHLYSINIVKVENKIPKKHYLCTPNTETDNL